MAALALLPPVRQAQTVTATVNVGSIPAAVAVNPVTNKTYVASGPITVIDGATNAITGDSFGTLSPVPATCQSLPDSLAFLTAPRLLLDARTQQRRGTPLTLACGSSSICGSFAISLGRSGNHRVQRWLHVVFTFGRERNACGRLYPRRNHYGDPTRRQSYSVAYAAAYAHGAVIPYRE